MSSEPTRSIPSLLQRGANRRTVLGRAALAGLAAPAAALLSRGGGVFAQATPEAAAAPTGDPIKIGLPYNLTGGLASIDGPSKNGSVLAANEINAAGGVLGRPLEVLVEDGKTDIPTNASIAKKLVEEDKVVAMVGLTDTSYVKAAGPVAQENQIPFIDAGGTAPVITSIGDYIFMVPFGDNVQAAVAAEFAQKQGWKTCAMLVDEAMDYTKYLAKYFKERFTAEDIGGSVVAELAYNSGDTDFSAQLTQFKNLDPAPDFFFISAGPGEVGTIMKQARDTGLTQPILGGDGYDTPLLTELGGPLSDVYFTTHQGIYDDSPAVTAFGDAYEAAYGTAPESIFAALGYDGLKLMADAIERAGTTDGPAVRDALAATKDFPGVTGTITYPEGERIPQKSVALVQVTDGKIALLEIATPAVIPPA